MTIPPRRARRLIGPVLVVALVAVVASRLLSRGTAPGSSGGTVPTIGGDTWPPVPLKVEPVKVEPPRSVDPSA
jgi:hypothetical protein